MIICGNWKNPPFGSCILFVCASASAHAYGMYACISCMQHDWHAVFLEAIACGSQGHCRVRLGISV